MKKALLPLAFLAMSATVAAAADLPSRKGAPAYAPPPPVMTWSGFYAGLNLGGGWGAGNGNSNAWNLNGWNGGITNNLASSGTSGGIIGGGQVGYNYAITPQVIIGAEADFQGTGLGAPGNNNQWAWGLVPNGNGQLVAGYYPYGGARGVSLDWFGTVRGRLGYAVMPSLLLYGTGGFVYGGVQRNGGYWGTNTGSATQTGWTAGGGAEWMFMQNWSAKAEYLYSDIAGSNTNEFGWNTGLSLNNVNNHTRWNTVRAGVNYHFNLGAVPTMPAF